MSEILQEEISFGPLFYQSEAYKDLLKDRKQEHDRFNIMIQIGNQIIKSQAR